MDTSKTELTQNKSRTIDEGTLSQLKELSYDDYLLLIKMLPDYSELLSEFLFTFSNISDITRFLDLFAGMTIRLPSRNKIYHAIRKINIWRYYQHLRDTNTSDDNDRLLYLTAKRFQLGKQYITTIIEFMKTLK